MKPSQLLIGITLFVIIIVGGYGWLISSYDNTTPSTFNTQQLAILNKSLERAEKIQSTQSALQSTLNTSASDSTQGALNALIQTSWSTLKTLPEYFGFFSDIMISVAAIFGVSDPKVGIIIGLITSIITISIIFSIFSAIFQKDL